MAQRLAQLWGEGASVELASDEHAPHEAGLLRLDVNKAAAELGWRPRWSLEQALVATVSWQKGFEGGTEAGALCLEQIKQFQHS